MNTFTLGSIITFFFSLFVLSSASPIAKRDVYTPRIIIPWAKTYWAPGHTYNVTWDTSDAPKQISNGALITLQSHADPKFGPITLTKGFDLRSGRTEVYIPKNVPSGINYFITLFGDSGDVSAVFAIGPEYEES